MIRVMVVGLLALCGQVTVASIPAQQCDSLQCVRLGIDQINTTIVHLVGERLRYVKRAGELKNKNQPTDDPKRNEAILKSVGEAAKKAGYSPEIAQAIFKTILAQSIAYERQFHHVGTLKKGS
jgi:isochorismate pyruvate lyase